MNPRDGGAWWAAVYEVVQSQTRLQRLSSSNNTHTTQIRHWEPAWQAFSAPFYRQKKWRHETRQNLSQATQLAKLRHDKSWSHDFNISFSPDIELFLSVPGILSSASPKITHIHLPQPKFLKKNNYVKLKTEMSFQLSRIWQQAAAKPPENT